MLHRAHAYITSKTAGPHEVTVLFDVPLSEMAKDGGPYRYLQQLLGWVWGCQAEQVQAYNLLSESEMRRNWGAGTTGHHPDHDLCLLCIGEGPDGPNYQLANRTLVLVGYLWLQRLSRARERIDMRAANRAQLQSAYRRAPPARDLARRFDQPAAGEMTAWGFRA